MSRRRSPDPTPGLAAQPAIFPLLRQPGIPNFEAPPAPPRASGGALRGHSSAGRALQWHCRGHRFDPGWLHQLNQGVGRNWLTPCFFRGSRGEAPKGNLMDEIRQRRHAFAVKHFKRAESHGWWSIPLLTLLDGTSRRAWTSSTWVAKARAVARN